MNQNASRISPDDCTCAEVEDANPLEERILNILLDGLPTRIVVSTLCSSGFDYRLVLRALEDTVQHRVFEVGRQHARESRKISGLLEHYDIVARQSEAAPVVDEVSELSFEAFLQDYYATNIPVIVRQGARHWGSASWSPQSLATRFPDARLTYYTNSGRRYQHDIESVATTTLREFVGKLDRTVLSNAFYVVAANAVLNGPELKGLTKELGDLTCIPAFASFRSSANLWLGPRGTITTLHYDIANNVFVQIFGRKKVLLASPFERRLLYNTTGVYSEVDPVAIDVSRHPLAANVRWLEAELLPGDILFIPCAWWHWVYSLDHSISVNVNFSFSGGTDQWTGGLE